MNGPTSHRVFEALAAVHELLIALARELRSSPFVRTAVASIQPRSYATGTVIECYVDAELNSGNALGWWLEFKWSDGLWEIESSVRHNTAAGEDVLVELPNRFAVDDDELAAELRGAGQMLVATVDSVRLDAL